MYLYLGQSVLIPYESIVGIFDLDNTTWSYRTRAFLDRAQEQGRVMSVGSDLPRCLVLCCEENGEEVVYLSQFNTTTLTRRVGSHHWLGGSSGESLP